jgi:hypothetical protein
VPVGSEPILCALTKPVSIDTNYLSTLVLLLYIAVAPFTFSGCIPGKMIVYRARKSLLWVYEYNDDKVKKWEPERGTHCCIQFSFLY